MCESFDDKGDATVYEYIAEDSRNVNRGLASESNRSDVSRRLVSQLLGAGTSVGANVEEAGAADSRKHFISVRAIALRECRETVYWLRPLVAAQGQTVTSKLIRDHEVELDSQSGLISILGGKWTTHRLMAQDTIDAVERELVGREFLVVGDQDHAALLRIESARKVGNAIAAARARGPSPRRTGRPG